MSRFRNLLAVTLTSTVALGILSAPHQANAASLTFVFTCQVVSSLTPDQCVAGGTGPNPNPNFGTLTLSDSLIDPNRVDIS